MTDGSPPRSRRSSELASQHDAAAAPPGAAALRSTGGIFGLPLWLRWVLSLGVVLVLGVALVLFVEHHGSDSQTTTDPAAVLRANREAEILVEQDQAPHLVRLSSGAAPAAALQLALHAAMARLIATGQINGPLGRSTCTPAGTTAGARRSFSCRVLAARVSYPFVGVVDRRARRITYCKRDPPPIPSQNIPVSRRCL